MLLVVLVVIAGFSMLKRHVKTNSAGEMTVKSDVIVYVNAGKAILNGNNIYYYPNGLKNSYVYLPFFAFINIPLSFVDPLIVDIGWYLLNVFLIAVIIRFGYYIFTYQPMSILSSKEKWFYYSLAILFSSRYLVRNAQDANVNIVILFLIASSFYFYLKTDKPMWFVLIGIAGAIKIFPLIFLVYFIAKKQYKIAGYIILSFTIATVLPVLSVGFNTFFGYIQLFLQYGRRILSPSGALVENFSLWGTLVRLFSNNKAFIYKGTAVYINIASVDVKYLKYLVYIINIAILIIAYWIAKKENRFFQQKKHRLGNGALIFTLLAMNFVSVLIEEHHVVTFLLVYLYLLIAMRKKLVRTIWLPCLVYFTGILSLITTHDAIVPAFGKIFLLKMLSFSIPILPVGIILFFLVYSVFKKTTKEIYI